MFLAKSSSKCFVLLRQPKFRRDSTTTSIIWRLDGRGIQIQVHDELMELPGASLQQHNDYRWLFRLRHWKWTLFCEIAWLDEINQDRANSESHLSGYGLIKLWNDWNPERSTTPIFNMQICLCVIWGQISRFALTRRSTNSKMIVRSSHLAVAADRAVASGLFSYTSINTVVKD